jgi:hypothetical protein
MLKNTLLLLSLALGAVSDGAGAEGFPRRPVRWTSRLAAAFVYGQSDYGRPR